MLTVKWLLQLNAFFETRQLYSLEFTELLIEGNEQKMWNEVRKILLGSCRCCVNRHQELWSPKTVSQLSNALLSLRLGLNICWWCIVHYCLFNCCLYCLWSVVRNFTFRSCSTSLLHNVVVSHHKTVALLCRCCRCYCFELIFVRLVTFDTREAIGSYAENQKITAIRKVYQRGVVNPMLSIELLWKEYCAFEHVRTVGFFTFRFA